MNTRNATQPETTAQTAKIGKGLAKRTASKFTRDYWFDRVYRPKYGTAEEGYTQVAQWWVRIHHAGRRDVFATGSNDRTEAARRAARFYAVLKSEGWAKAFAQFAPDRAGANPQAPTVGELIEAARKAADVAPATLQGYLTCLRNLTAEALGVKGDASRFDYHGGGSQSWRARVDRIRLDKLTPARVQAALNRRIAEARGNPLAEQKARVTAASILRQAKSLFSPQLKLPFASLPNPFDGVRVKAAGVRPYVSTVNAGELLRAGKAELGDADPEAYKALLLCLGAGLRKAEADTLQWQQVDAEAGVIRVATTEVFDPKTEASAGQVFVDAGLVRELEPFRAKATGALFVLESEFAPKPNAPRAYYRAATTWDRLTRWLRGKGILAHKPIHTLRKEFGSLVAASSDVHTASRQLRHATIGITSRYYLDSRRRVAPPIAEFLAETKSQTAVDQS